MIRALKKQLVDTYQQRRGVRLVRKTGFWFVDIPRTSSSSIKAEFARHFGPAYGKNNLIDTEYISEQLFNDHIPADEMRFIIGDDYWRGLYTFTFVRNPYDRIASLYHYRRKRNVIPNAWSFSEFVHRLVNADQATPYFQFHGHRYGASDFILDKDGTVLVEDVFRFENRSAGIQQITKKLELKSFGSFHLQGATPHDRNYRSMYDDPTRDLISERFATDINLFDYDF